MPFSELRGFVERAIKNRKYPESTGRALIAALKLFERELNEDEAASIDVFRDNFEQIYRNLFTKNPSLNASSLATYKSRVSKVLEDYAKYGTDLTKIASWTPKIQQPRAAKKTAKNEQPETTKSTADDSTETPSTSSINIHRIELALRPNSKFVLLVPKDITLTEATMIKTLLDSLVSTATAYAQQSRLQETPGE